MSRAPLDYWTLLSGVASEERLHWLQSFSADFQAKLWKGIAPDSARRDIYLSGALEYAAFQQQMHETEGVDACDAADAVGTQSLTNSGSNSHQSSRDSSFSSHQLRLFAGISAPDSVRSNINVSIGHGSLRIVGAGSNGVGVGGLLNVAGSRASAALGGLSALLHRRQNSVCSLMSIDEEALVRAVETLAIAGAGDNNGDASKHIFAEQIKLELEAAAEKELIESASFSLLGKVRRAVTRCSDQAHLASCGAHCPHPREYRRGLACLAAAIFTVADLDSTAQRIFDAFFHLIHSAPSSSSSGEVHALARDFARLSARATSTRAPLPSSTIVATPPAVPGSDPSALEDPHGGVVYFRQLLRDESLVLAETLLQLLPSLCHHLDRCGIDLVDLSDIACEWVASLFASYLPTPFVLRVLDLVIFLGVGSLFAFVFGLLQVMSAELLQQKPEGMYAFLSGLTGVMSGVQLEKAFEVGHLYFSRSGVYAELSTGNRCWLCVFSDVLHCCRAHSSMAGFF